MGLAFLVHVDATHDVVTGDEETLGVGQRVAGFRSPTHLGKEEHEQKSETCFG